MEVPMFRKLFLPGLILTFLTAVMNAGQMGGGDLRVLAPISHGNLTIFPVVGAGANDNVHLLTLDEGLRLGTVTVTETGAVRPLVRGHVRQQSSQGEVNRLVLMNDSDRPLLLLAGEIVTGGKQDRVIGADRIIPAKSGPVDLSVFCVEPGRWVASSDHFGTMAKQMAQPSVRTKAMAEKSQQQVWDSVGEARGVASGLIANSAPAAAQSVEVTSSYAKVMDMPEVQKEVTKMAGDYDGMLRELKKTNARGVVVAINGRIIWADVFANNELLEKYWQKLVRSYAAEALSSHSGVTADEKSAQRFIDQLNGSHEVVDTEPGVFRRSEVTGEGFKVFTLTSLLPKSEETVHIAKMAYAGEPVAALGQMVR
jgi:hypothetical protein